MNTGFFIMVYVISTAVYFLIRLAYMMRIGPREFNRGSPWDQFLIMMIVVSPILPLIYVLTPVLNFANYSLPVVLAWSGILMILASLLMLWRSHADLGTNFALTPCLKGGQSLIKQGVYRRIRHPMYTSLWLWAFSTPLLIQNWIVGFNFLIVFAAFYFERVPLEEFLMKEKFGQEYHDYMSETGRVIPKIR